MSFPSEPLSPGRAARPPILSAVLIVLLAGAASAAVVLAILHFGPRSVSEPTRKDGNDSGVNAGGELVQKGAVKVEDAASTTVFYPVPYGSPPHLTLTTTSGSRKFAIDRQDELGFTWSMAPTEAEAKALADALKTGDGKDKEKGEKDKEKPNTKPDPGRLEFTWEAKGVHGMAASPYPKQFEQKGSFTAPWGQEGQVYLVID